MRGSDVMQETLFTTVHLDQFVPKDHPLRAIRLFDLDEEPWADTPSQSVRTGASDYCVPV